ncbi:F-box protein PP2-B3-like [Miscanthus floridulus]|uniref:F-box protein PP2-B3-like n=1 Tax=Miscanthus floridulus TaxID=154761 RepID=UPI003457CAEC
MTESVATATTIACEIVRRPVDLISASIALTGPQDACRAAVVSLAFRTAANSDIVWNSFLPSNLPLSALRELSPLAPSKKALFMRLSDGPVLLVDGLTNIWLDKETGAMCYMLSARKLSIDWSEMRRGGISRACGALLGDPRFSSQRADGWMELELGDFHNGEGDDGEVSISLVDTSFRRSGLIVLGIEIIAKGQEA